MSAKNTFKLQTTVGKHKSEYVGFYNDASRLWYVHQILDGAGLEALAGICNDRLDAVNLALSLSGQLVREP